MAKIVEEFVARFGVDVKNKDKLTDLENSIDNILGLATRAAAAFGAASAGLLAMVGVTNKATATQNNLAESVGTTIGFVQAMSDEVAQLDLNFENVVDLVEEMNNKFGEKKGLGQMTAVEEATKMLGINFKEIRDLKPEEQFVKIFDAAKDLGDQQKAVSAVDMLMGGEANKILGHLRNVEGSLGEIIERRMQLNFLTEEGTRGAIAFNESLGFIISSGKSMFQEFSGLLGEALTPFLAQIRVFIMNNRELIKQKISEWADAFRRAIEWLMSKLKLFLPIIERLPAIMKILGTLVASAAFLKGLIIIQKIAAAWKAAGTAALFAQAKMMLIPLAIAAIVLLVEDIYGFLEGKDSVTEKLLRGAEDWLGIDLVEPIRAAWPEIKEFLGNWWEGMKNIIEGVVIAVTAVVQLIVGIFTKGLGPAWDEFIENMTREFAGAIDLVKNLWLELRDFVAGIWDGMLTKAKGFMSEVKGVLRNIPLVGGLFGSEENIKRGAAGIPRTSGGASSSSSSVNQNVSQNVGGITINAATGQSPMDVGRAVKQVLGENMAVAKRALSTGVVR